MITGKKFTHICETCKKPIEMTNPEYFNRRQDKEKLSLLRSGMVFNNYGPLCGGRIFPETRLLYQDTDNRMIVYYIDGKNKKAGKQEVLERIARDSMEGYSYRIVTDQGEFLEKTEMLLCGYDDRVLLLAKWFTFMVALEIDEKFRPENIWFETDEEGRSVWRIFYPEDYERIFEITPEQYAQYMDMFYDLAESSEEQICIDNKWGSDAAISLYYAMQEEQQ